MTRDLPGRKVVERHGVPFRSTSTCQRWVRRRNPCEGYREFGRCKKPRDFGPSRPRNMSVAPDVVPPADDLATPVEIGLDPDHHGGAEGRMSEFVLAGPLHPNQASACGASEKHRIECD